MLKGFDGFYSAEAEGLDDCFGSASHSFGSRPLLRNSTRSPLFAENSTPDCFLNAQTLTGSSPYSKKRTDTAVAMPVLLAGAEGLEVASQPLLRFPKLASGLERRQVLTAAPTNTRFIVRRTRSYVLPRTLRVPR